MLYKLLDITLLDSAAGVAAHETFLSPLYARAIQSDGQLVPASVCVFPQYAGQVQNFRRSVVAGSFPMGAMPLETKRQEVEWIVQNRLADEIDYVINRAPFMEGDEAALRTEIAEIREICAGYTLKIILETGELLQPELIRRASRIALEAGADFLKTSTGKMHPGANAESVQILAVEILQFFKDTGELRGLKISGGVSDIETAETYVRQVREVLGDEFISNRYFRIGASKLADRLAEGAGF